jgi:hypothetical protein
MVTLTSIEPSHSIHLLAYANQNKAEEESSINGKYLSGLNTTWLRIQRRHGRHHVTLRMVTMVK